jgi:hypothetical protein
MCVVWLSVLMQPGADEGIRGERTNEGDELGGDSAWAETTARRASTAKTAGDEIEVEANVSAEALAIDAATAPEVWMLESGFVLGWAIFVEFKRCTKHAQVPQGSGPRRGMDIIYVVTPSGEAAEKSSSYNLPIFFFWC